MTPTIGSLCSGVGGLETGIERALDARTIWQSEIDPHASTVLAHHWPDVPNLGDLTTVDWANVEPVDLMCFGFPCQDISQAGRKAGIEGDRSALWFACWLGTNAENDADKRQKGRAPQVWGTPLTRSRQTHCTYGHEFTPENTRVMSTGHRRCRQCERDRSRAYYWRQNGQPRPQEEVIEGARSA